MLPDQHFLRTPGPTPIPPSVQQAMHQPMVGHRDQETKELLCMIKPKLKRLFGTDQDVLLLAGSGTAGLEAAVINIVHPDDEVLVLVSGAFGERFVQICRKYRIKTHRLDMAWGKAVTPESVADYLQRHPRVKAVLATFCETSTGVLNPVHKIASAIQHYSNAIFIVDGVSAIGAVQTKMDDWAIDILITGSQKAMMLPPGLVFLVVSERAWYKIKTNERPSFYLDLYLYQKQLQNNTTPFTPPLSLLFGLQQVLKLFDEEGLDNVFTRHHTMMNMTRAACRALGICLLTDDRDASPTVTAARADDLSPDMLRHMLKKEFNLIVAGGQNDLKGKLFRIGHMGYCSPADILQTISIIELALHKMGQPIELGSGVQAAQKIMLSGGT